MLNNIYAEVIYLKFIPNSFSASVIFITFTALSDSLRKKSFEGSDFLLNMSYKIICSTWMSWSSLVTCVMTMNVDLYQDFHFSLWLIMAKNSSARYYKRRKENLKEKSMKGIKWSGDQKTDFIKYRNNKSIFKNWKMLFTLNDI